MHGQQNIKKFWSGIYWLCEKPLASQEGRYSMDLTPQSFLINISHIYIIQNFVLLRIRVAVTLGWYMVTSAL
jgi:hypothetical protein